MHLEVNLHTHLLPIFMITTVYRLSYHITFSTNTNSKRWVALKILDKRVSTIKRLRPSLNPTTTIHPGKRTTLKSLGKQ